ncbi:MAG: hypothetical protein EHJ95_03455, partial [Methanobacteriota archaeon]
MMMKRFLIALLLVVALVAGASAYYVKVSAPASVVAGDPLTVTFENNVPAGFSSDVVIYKVTQTKREVTRGSITFQSGETVKTTFQTKGFAKGRYQVEILDPTKAFFGGSSTTWREFDVVNRSGDITFTAPLNQEFDGTLDVIGKI